MEYYTEFKKFFYCAITNKLFTKALCFFSLPPKEKKNLGWPVFNE